MHRLIINSRKGSFTHLPIAWRWDTSGLCAAHYRWFGRTWLEGLSTMDLGMFEITDYWSSSNRACF